MKLGFSVGALHKTNVSPMSAEAVQIMRGLGCTVIELSVIRPERIAGLQKMTRADLAGFEYVSLHAPALDFAYENSQAVSDLFTILIKAHKKFNFDAIVVHPDLVKDWRLFENAKLPWAFENMDSRKAFGRGRADLAQIFSNIPAKMVVDMQHVYTNDQSMRLAQELQATFADRITHFHVSGFSPEHNHYPLFKTQQAAIVESVANRALPIIIESVVSNVAELQPEYDYIRKILNS